MIKKQNLLNRFFLTIAVVFTIWGNIYAGSKSKTKTINNYQIMDKKKVLFVVSSHAKLGETGKSTGYYLSEVSHTWKILHDSGYIIDFVSPLGGKAPVDGFNLTDLINKEFWENTTYREKIENTMKPKDVQSADYQAIFYAGGHGTMWDFKDNVELAKIAADIYEQEGIVSAVCHGPAALVDIKLSDGTYLVAGKKISAFTNEEEKAAQLEQVVPFMLETALINRGAQFVKADLWQAQVSSDKRVITGQNPASATGVGQAILKELELKNSKKTK